MSTEEETLQYPTPNFDKQAYDELKEFVRRWVQAGHNLTEADIQRWRDQNLKKPKQLSLFETGEVRDVNVAICPWCKGRGCEECDGGVIRVTERTFK